jgi:hypothetical protein
MTILDRFNIKVVASTGLCAAAIALSPDAAASPFMTGGYACIQSSAGGAAAPAAAGGPVAAGAGGAGACVPASAPVADMAGIPMALPGPLPVGPPVAAGAPLTDMAGSYGGKGDPTGPPAPGAPLPGQPILPGPSAAG